MQLHFTPTSGSWSNLIEVFFSIITRQALRRGNFPTVADLIAAIGRFIDAWNDRCAPFTWTKDPRHRHRQGHASTEVVPSSVELRWRPVVRQAATTSPSCMTGVTV
ncbi:hypothetical protein SAMN06272737_1751, partial [Blastococcus mobilis]